MKKLIILALLIGAVGVSGATYTSSQTGNWSDVATWGGGGYPVDGDKAIVSAGHTVTVNTASVCGLASTADSSLVIRGTLLGTDNLTVNGTVKFSTSGVFTQSAGTTMLIGGTYPVIYESGAHWNINGTSVSRATVRSPVSTYWTLAGTTGTKYLFLNWQYADIKRMGNNTVRSYIDGENLTWSLVLNHCLIDSSGALFVGYNGVPGAGLTVNITNNDWRNCQHAYIFYLKTVPMSVQGNINITGNTFKSDVSGGSRIDFVYMTSPTNKYINFSNNVLKNVVLNLGRNTKVNTTFIYNPAITYGTTVNFVSLDTFTVDNSVVYGTTSNTHLVNATNAIGVANITDNVSVSAGVGVDTDNHYLPTEFNGSWNILRCLAIGNNAVATRNGPFTAGTINIDRLTHIGKTNFDAAILNEGSQPSGTINVRSVLEYSLGANAKRIINRVDSLTTFNDIWDYVDYNNIFNRTFADRYNPAVTMSTRVLGDAGFGASDISVDPQFFNPIASLELFDKNNGGDSTVKSLVGNLLSMNGFDSTGAVVTPDADYTVSNLRSYIQHGFTPMNTALGGAGYSSEDIGARDVVYVPTINTHPISDTLASGASCTLRVAYTGTPPLSFQWQKNTVNLDGYTEDSLVFGVLDSADYRLIVTNTFGSDTSNSAVVDTSKIVIPPLDFSERILFVDMTLELPECSTVVHDAYSHVLHGADNYNPNTRTLTGTHRVYKTALDGFLAANPGDTLYLRGGDYEETINFLDYRNYTSTLRGYMASYPDEWAVIHGNIEYRAIGGARNYTFERFEIDSACISVARARNLIFRYLYIHDSPVVGPGSEYVNSGIDLYNSDNAAQNNLITQCCLVDNYNANVKFFGDYYSNPALIDSSIALKRNEVSYNYMVGSIHGIHYKNMQLLCRDNTGVDVDNKALGDKIHHNIIKNPSGQTVLVQDFMQVYNNVFDSCEVTIGEQYSTKREPFYVCVYNNTFSNTTLLLNHNNTLDYLGCYYVDYAGTDKLHSNFYAYNNLFYDTSAIALPLRLYYDDASTLGLENVDLTKIHLKGNLFTPQITSYSSVVLGYKNNIYYTGNLRSVASEYINHTSSNASNTDYVVADVVINGDTTTRNGGVNIAHPYLSGIDIPEYIGANDNTDSWIAGVKNLTNLNSDYSPLKIPVTITSQPSNVNTSIGLTATFTVVASGSGTLTYQWQHDSVDILGATNSTYSATAESIDSGTVFRCIVVGDTIGDTSNAAELIVHTFLQPPVLVPIADTLTLCTDAEGECTYQWYRNGVLVIGETNPCITIEVAAEEYAAKPTWECRVTNTGGTVSQKWLLGVGSGGARRVNNLSTGLTIQ